MKIKFKAALTAAKSNGYTGEETADAVQKFLNTLNVNFKIGTSEVAAKALQVSQPDPMTVQVTQIPDDAIEPAMQSMDPNANADNGLPTSTATKSRGGINEAEIENLVRKHLARNAPITISGGLPADEVAYNNKPMFTRTGVRRKMFKNAETAKAFGAWFLSETKFAQSADCASRREEARKAFHSTDIGKKSLTLNPASAGVLAATMFMPELIQLFDEYGVAAASANIIPTTEKNVARAQSLNEILNYGYPEEGSAPTASDQDFRIVNQTLHSLFILCAATRQTLKYSFVDVGDSIASDIVRTAAYAEDQAAFNGIGTAAFGRIQGLLGAFTISSVAGLTITTAAGATNVNVAGTTAASWSDYTIGHFQNLMSLPPAYVRRKFNDCAWYCHHKFDDNVISPLRILPGKTFAAGATAQEVSTNANGEKMFLGYPVRHVENMNSTSAAASGTIDCYFGSLSRGMDLARGNNLEVERNDSVGFTSGMINYRGIMDHDVNVVHGVGTTTKAGPIACLYQI